MIDDIYYQQETNIYDAPALCIPLIEDLTFPANHAPDIGAAGQVIYLHLTALNGPDSEQVTTQAVLPLITQDGLAWGGQIPFRPPIVVPKLILEGYIDTPSVQVGEYYLPEPFDSISDTYYSYAEIIAMMMEGRANQQAVSSSNIDIFSGTVGGSGAWGRLDPLWFRDPYGRVYENPRILAFTAQLVIGVPERSQITMTLKVGPT